MNIINGYRRALAYTALILIPWGITIAIVLGAYEMRSVLP